MLVNNSRTEPGSLLDKEQDNQLVEDSLNRILNETELFKPGIDFFFIVENRRFVRIRFSDICSIEANRSYLTIKTTKEKYLVVGSLAKLEKKLPPSVFCRIHRAWIVPVDGITIINKERIMVNDNWYPLGSMYRKMLIRRLSPYVFNKRSLDDMD
jgi:two-component system LytT family response regulator